MLHVRFSSGGARYLPVRFLLASAPAKPVHCLLLPSSCPPQRSRTQGRDKVGGSAQTQGEKNAFMNQLRVVHLDKLPDAYPSGITIPSAERLFVLSVFEFLPLGWKAFPSITDRWHRARHGSSGSTNQARWPEPSHDALVQTQGHGNPRVVRFWTPSIFAHGLGQGGKGLVEPPGLGK